MSHTIFLIIALVTTGIFLIQFVLSIFFGDIDADVDVDADISSVVSFKGLTHFGIGFGWYMYLVGNADIASYAIGILVGLFFVFAVWFLYKKAYQLQQVNRDGKITPEDRTMIGNPTPDFTYGLSLGVNYKNWSLGIDMMGQHGNEIFRTWDNYNFAQFNYLSQRMDRWHGEGTSNTQPLLNTKHSINNLNSDYYIENGSFFRIRNVQLAYTFDKSLIAKIRLQALKVYVNIQNLKTWKHNTGYTPELGGTATAFGVDNGSYPVPAVYTFGINLTF